MSETEKTQLEKDREAAEVKAKAENDTRTGVGKRVMVGATRGRNTSVISYDAWDEDSVDTLPKTVKQFMEVGKVTDEAELVKRLIIGDNDLAYRLASDEILEFVEPTWTPEFIAKFRIVVRGYASAMKISIEDAVKQIKPGMVAGLAAQ